MKKLSFACCLSFLGFVFLSSCEKDKFEDQPVVQNPGAYDNGIFICNEGPFMSGTGTVSFYNTAKNTFYEDVYDMTNHVALGNIVQSMTIIKNKGYIVVNNANKIEVVDINNFSRIATIEGLVLPRFIVGVDDETAYVSCWDNTVAVINLNNNTVTGHINCAEGPELMLKYGDYVYVLNQGGFETDSIISVIDTKTRQVLKNLVVGERPSGIVADKNGIIWVMCSGKGYNGWPQPGDSKGKLLKINPADFSIESSGIQFNQDMHPEKLAINSNADTMFFIYKGGICKLGINSSSTSVEPFLKHSSGIYAMGFDKKGNQIVFSDPVDYVQNGWVYFADPVGGLKTDSIRAGIIPGFFCFN